MKTNVQSIGLDGTIADCGCFTDDDGFWVMSPECVRTEQTSWEHIVEAARKIYSQSPRRSAVMNDEG